MDAPERRLLNDLAGAGEQCRRQVEAEPTIFDDRGAVEAGGFISYGVNQAEGSRHARRLR
jgi:hypothetical protein